MSQQTRISDKSLTRLIADADRALDMEPVADSEWWTPLRLALLELKEVRAGGLKRDVSERTAGWGRPARSKKYHYFAENEVTSICRRWMYSGEREPDSFESPDDCAVCRRKLNKGNEQEATREQN